MKIIFVVYFRGDPVGHGPCIVWWNLCCPQTATTRYDRKRRLGAGVTSFSEGWSRSLYTSEIDPRVGSDSSCFPTEPTRSGRANTSTFFPVTVPKILIRENFTPQYTEANTKLTLQKDLVPNTSTFFPITAPKMLAPGETFTPLQSPKQAPS